jgi:hypothetical protein
MRRHGWTFCLGLLATGAALAQPPADGERFPPAPDLPGTVVSKQAGPRPVATTGQEAVRTTSMQAPVAPPAEPGKLPKPGPYLPVATVVQAPPPAPTPVPPATSCVSPGCASGEHGSILDWLCYRSRVREWGSIPKKYVPPLQAWFPCPARPGCSTCAAPVGVAIETGAPVGKPAPSATPEAPKEPPVKQLGGVNFSPGVAPMASPTTQTNVRSSWRPK